MKGDGDHLPPDCPPLSDRVGCAACRCEGCEGHIEAAKREEASE